MAVYIQQSQSNIQAKVGSQNKSFMRTAIRQKIKFDKNLIDKNAIEVIKTLNKANFEGYLVGGCIRDLLLNIQPKDFDIATNATPNQARKLFKKSILIGRRFRLLHVLFPKRHIIEVSTFRSSCENNKEIKNIYGTIEEDVFRRDFTINALYYDLSKFEIIDYVGGLEDINSLNIKMIGNIDERFVEDPVRMIRAIRFENKLSTKLSKEMELSIKHNAKLLTKISPDRLFGECIKLFHSKNSFEAFVRIDNLGILKYLFKKTMKNLFIEKALINTSSRIEENKSITPSFLFAVFLWQEYEKKLKKLNNNKSKKINTMLMKKSAESIIKEQNKQVSIPKWVARKIYETWFMQHKLENYNIKNTREVLSLPNFRMAYDFLLLRADSINPELKEQADFWTAIQK